MFPTIPCCQDYKGARLLGSSKVDDDAVQTRETKLVEHGVLKDSAFHSRSGAAPSPTAPVAAADGVQPPSNPVCDLGEITDH